MHLIAVRCFDLAVARLAFIFCISYTAIGGYLLMTLWKPLRLIRLGAIDSYAGGMPAICWAYGGLRVGD